MHAICRHMIANRLLGPLFGLALAAMALQPSATLAQAWLPDAGTISFSLVYNDVLNREHYVANGDEVDVGQRTTLVREGARSDEVFVIVDGSAEVAELDAGRAGFLPR